MEMDEKAVFPSVLSDHFEQLHPSLFCNGRKFHTDFLLALLRNMLAVADKNS
jgi:hypothetical protein